MWKFEGMNGEKGEGDEPTDAVIDALGDETPFTDDEVTSDEAEIIVRDAFGDVIGYCTYEEEEDDLG